MSKVKTQNEKDWYIVDANNKILGRLATKIANTLYGKEKVNFMPNFDMGDYVVVINAQKIKLTGNKYKTKKYYRHTGYPGGIKEETLEKLLERKPEEVIIKAVKGMLPKNKLGKEAIKRLKVFKNDQYSVPVKELREL